MLRALGGQISDQLVGDRGPIHDGPRTDISNRRKVERQPAWSRAKVRLSQCASLALSNHNVGLKQLVLPLKCYVVREYPVSADEYELLEEAGRGVSATVRLSDIQKSLCSCQTTAGQYLS